MYSGLVWNGYTSSPYGDPEFIRVFVPSGTSVEREVVEFFDGDTPLEIAGTRRSDVAAEGACAGDAIDYDLSGLPSGTYTMVHRRSAAPGGLTTTDGPWTTFQGEAALVTAGFQPEGTTFGLRFSG